MERLFLILELAGTLAFAASGAITGLKKNMDIFGVCILGLTTAVGGGVIRDVILGITPPTTFLDPIYAVVALLTSLVLFLPRIRRLLMWDQRLYDLVLLIMDSAGSASSPWRASASPTSRRPGPRCSCWCSWGWSPAWAAASCGT